MKKILCLLIPIFFSCQKQEENIISSKMDTIIRYVYVDTNLIIRKANLQKVNKHIKKNIADRPIELANFLETTAFIIKDNKTRYRWNEQQSCNVGILAQLATGLTPTQLRVELNKYPISEDLYPNDNASWSAFVSQYCPITGEDMPKIMQALMDVGCERDDLYHLEYLDNIEIIKHANLNIENDVYTDPVVVSKYMLAWAKMIRSYHKKINQNKEGASAMPATPHQSEELIIISE